ncbi:copper amine oxidase N-terminal domain-containing protein [Kyrpidia spormannii]|uniref:Uncharacterized protein n=1 Tax=Kyrpidia spormannii TaxID=2055160 RepID=A0ACA8ZDW4_9BACL|nr:copper amine oxidase N-terminal domain-containing protein [Kyrpidia spormannii]CAB3395528.1 conserved exported protein of unknown function [Kyrpidia spormannii]
MKRGKKALAVLSTAALLGTTPAAVVGLPLLTSAVAYAADYTVSNPPALTAGKDQDLGALKVSFDATGLVSGSAVTVRLPSDFDLHVAVNQDLTTTGATISDPNAQTYIYVPSASNALDPQTDVTATVTASNEIKVKINSVAHTDQDTGYFYVVFKNVFVPGGFSGPVNVTIEGSANSPFNDGQATVATVGSGVVKLSVDSTKFIGDQTTPIDTIRLKEDRPGAVGSNQTIKLKLPSGFQWVDSSNIQLINNDTNINVLGSLYTKGYADDGRTLVLTRTATSANSALYLRLTGLEVQVSDSNVAKYGDVVVSVGGTASVDVSSLTIGTYGDYGVTVSAANPQNVLAGRNEEEIGQIIIQETAPNSLIDNRTIKLTLSGNARWAADSNGKPEGPYVDTAASDLEGVTSGSFGSWDWDGSAHDTIKATIDVVNESKGAKIVLKGGKIVVAAGAQQQDINVTVGGSAGANGDAGVVAHVVSPVTASIDGTAPDLTVGGAAQDIAPIIIKETQAGAIDAGSITTADTISGQSGTSGYRELVLEFFQNEVPSLPASVQVTDGDIVLDTGNVYRYVTPDGRWQIRIPVKSTSSAPSTIKISGIKLTTDRTTPYGPVNVAIKGDAVVQSSDVIPGYTAAASVTVANLATPAPQQTVATFTVGSTTYTVNGQQQTMDVAPYLKNDGRVMLPVRFVANALGVTDDHIIWNGADQSVTIFKGNTVAKMTVGSNTMVVNGVAVQMDVAPELYNDGRVMLPIRWIGQALGAQLTWDQNTQTVTVTSQQ